MRFYHIKREDFTRTSGIYMATLFVFGVPLLSRTQKFLPHYFAESSANFTAESERQRERERVNLAIYFLFIKFLALGFLLKRHKGDFILRIV